jgi:hypothetical protein
MPSPSVAGEPHVCINWEWIQYLSCFTSARGEELKSREQKWKGRVANVFGARPQSVKATGQFWIQHSLFRCVSMIGVSISSG